MKKIILYTLPFFFIIITAMTVQQNNMNELQQLTGTWRMQTAKRTIYESWQKAGSTSMLGRSFFIRGTDTVVMENIELSQKEKDIYYIPIVSNQNGGQPTSFKLVSSANKTFVFENPEHDFPQRVIYHLVSKDSVHAWIEGKNKGKDARSDFYYSRVF